MKRIRTSFLALLSLLFVLGLVSVACSSVDEQTIIPIKQQITYAGEQELERESEEKLKFAILSNVSIKETYHTYYNFIHHLEEELGMEIEIIQLNTYDEILSVFTKGEADAGLVCGYLSVLGSEQGVMERIAMPIINGKEQYTSYIITRKESEINSLHDLKGKSFAFSDPDSFAGYLVPKYLIESEGYDFSNFFERTFFTYSHDHSIAAVVNGLVDAAAVYSTSYDKLVKEQNPLIEEIKVVAEGAFVGNQPIIVNPSLSSTQKEELKKALLHLHEKEAGQEVLELLNYDYFVEADDRLFSPALIMLESLNEKP